MLIVGKDKQTNNKWNIGNSAIR